MLVVGMSVKVTRMTAWGSCCPHHRAGGLGPGVLEALPCSGCRVYAGTIPTAVIGRTSDTMGSVVVSSRPART